MGPYQPPPHTPIPHLQLCCPDTPSLRLVGAGEKGKEWDCGGKEGGVAPYQCLHQVRIMSRSVSLHSDEQEQTQNQSAWLVDEN